MRWPIQLSLCIAPAPATRASGLRQRSKEATDRRNKKKAERGYLPLWKRHSFGRPAAISNTRPAEDSRLPAAAPAAFDGRTCDNSMLPLCASPAQWRHESCVITFTGIRLQRLETDRNLTQTKGDTARIRHSCDTYCRIHDPNLARIRHIPKRFRHHSTQMLDLISFYIKRLP